MSNFIHRQDVTMAHPLPSSWMTNYIAQLYEVQSSRTTSTLDQGRTPASHQCRTPSTATTYRFQPRLRFQSATSNSSNNIFIKT